MVLMGAPRVATLAATLMLIVMTSGVQGAMFHRRTKYEELHSLEHRLGSHVSRSALKLASGTGSSPKPLAASGVTFSFADYLDALNKTLLFLEAQRSGPLPSSQRVRWRGDSALTDGKLAGVDLVGGYYDAGDNIKFGLPMAYTTTMMAWVTLQYAQQLKLAGQFQFALDAVKWGTDYFIKAHTKPDELYVQVGEVGADHSCWMRPEDMTTPRTVYKVGGSTCGSDVAGETAAALAAASLLFKPMNPSYSATLITHARQLFTFATTCLGKYSDAVSNVNPYYTSYSGFEDELLWGAVWLYKATQDASYFNYIVSKNSQYQWSYKNVRELNWDDKNAAAQLLLTQILLTGSYPPSPANTAMLKDFQKVAEAFACNQIPPYNQVTISPGGHIWVRDVNNQYVTNAAYMLSALADSYLDAGLPGIKCSGNAVPTSTILAFAKKQMDYILGDNPLKMSFMVGFGPQSVKKPHHRGSSLPSVFQHPSQISCNDGWDLGFNVQGPNTQTLLGAIVGGPDGKDAYADVRSDYKVNEPCTYIQPAATGALVRILIGYKGPGNSTAPPPPPPPPSPPPPSTTGNATDVKFSTSVAYKASASVTLYSLTITNRGSRPISSLTFTPNKLYTVFSWGLIQVPAAPSNTLTLLGKMFPIAPGETITQLGFAQNTTKFNGPATFSVASLKVGS